MKWRSLVAEWRDLRSTARETAGIVANLLKIWRREWDSNGLKCVKPA
jgi:hypothetical protein